MSSFPILYQQPLLKPCQLHKLGQPYNLLEEIPSLGTSKDMLIATAQKSAVLNYDFHVNIPEESEIIKHLAGYFNIIVARRPELTSTSSAMAEIAASYVYHFKPSIEYAIRMPLFLVNSYLPASCFW